MQRFLSAVVLISVGALSPARAVAQASDVPETRSPAATSTAGATSAPGAKPPAAAKPASPAKPPVSKVSPATGEPKPKLSEHLSDEAELSRVVGLYEAGKYAECSREVERLLDPTGRAPLRQASIVENARVYWAACLLGEGAADAAEAPLRAAIHENPQMKPPDSLVFPQPVVEHFLRVRDSLVNEIRAAEQARFKQAQQEARQRQERLARDRDRLRQLEQLASQESVVVRNRRILSFVPFGVGQIQNREETLGYTLMASEALLGGLSIAAIAMQSKFATDGQKQAEGGKLVDNASLINGWGIVKRASAWGFIALAVGGVVQAQVAYVPEFRETRKRRSLPALPPSSVSRSNVDIAWLPYVDAKGAGVAFAGSF